MENEFFLEPNSSYTSMPTWQALSSAMEIQVPQMNSSTKQSTECFFTNWEMTMTDPNVQFDSTLSSMVSSPASNSNVSNESFVIRELIGKLGNIGNSGEISPHMSAAHAYVSASNSTNTSCYNTPLNSPPKLNLPTMDHIVKENVPKLPNSMPLNNCVADFSADPGFAERAAKFSCFGSRSFSGRTSQPVINNAELRYGSNSVVENGKLSRVCSSPSIKAIGSQLGVQERKNSSLQDRTELASSQEESAVSEQKLNGSNDSTSRKRKAASRGRAKEPATSPVAKVAECNEDSSAKRCKPNDDDKEENAALKEEEKQNGNFGNAEDEKQNKSNQKPPEPPKDYIHVRARRGQATDSHSLAERVRREKISERMKLLQDLVPGCNKVTGKALMLDEIINYVQSLQRQVEFLSMKLSSVNTRLDFNADTLLSKDMYQSNNSLQHPIFPLDSPGTSFYGHRPKQNPALSASISNGTVTQCSMGPLDSPLCQNLGMQLPLLNGMNESLTQYPTFCEDDLQAIVQMGFGKNSNTEAGFQSQSLQGSSQASHMKDEL